MLHKEKLSMKLFKRTNLLMFARVDSQSLAALALVNYAITDEKQKPNTQARLKRNRL